MVGGVSLRGEALDVNAVQERARDVNPDQPWHVEQLVDRRSGIEIVRISSCRVAYNEDTIRVKTMMYFSLGFPPNNPDVKIYYFLCLSLPVFQFSSSLVPYFWQL